MERVEPVPTGAAFVVIRVDPLESLNISLLYFLPTKYYLKYNLREFREVFSTDMELFSVISEFPPFFPEDDFIDIALSKDFVLFREDFGDDDCHFAGGQFVFFFLGEVGLLHEFLQPFEFPLLQIRSA